MIVTDISRQGTNSVKLELSVSKFGTSDLLPLWVADMDIASPLCVQEAISKRASHPLYGYTIYPNRYYEAIENWFLMQFNCKIDRESIVPSCGVVPSINFAIEASTQKEDMIIVQTPIYPPFVSVVYKHRRKLLDNKLIYNNGEYSIDFKDFEAKAKRAKLFLFCSPHNPTGRVWSLEELEKIVEICNRHGVIIVSDEVHSDIVYSKNHYTLALLAPKITILLTAPSKSFNIAGLNTSYAIISNSKLRKAYTSQQRKIGINDGNIFGIEALMAAYDFGEDWLEELRKYLQENIKFVNDFLDKNSIPIFSTNTEATYLMWLDCKGLGLDDKALEHFFIYKAKLGLNSGISFGEGGSGFMRLNIATSKEILKEAMFRLQNAYID